MTDHVLLEWDFTGYDQVLSCKQFVDIDWLNACQAAKIIHKCYAWMPQCCLCPYRYWSMLGVHANAKAEDWLGATYSRYKGAQTLAVSSSSCWFLKRESKSQSLTFSWVVINELLISQKMIISRSPTKSWVMSGPQRADVLSKLGSSPNHGQIDSKPQFVDKWVHVTPLLAD